MMPSLYKLVRMGALAGPGIAVALSGGSGEEKIKDIIKVYTGWDTSNNRFDFQELMKGWTPFLGASLVTYGIPKLTGLIRRL